MTASRKRRLTLPVAILAFAMAWAFVRAQDPGSGQRGEQRQTRERTAHRPSVPGVNGLATSGHPLVSMAGARVLLKGGNAFDAAVAMLATANVMEPEMNGAGGNGFLTIYDKKTNKVYALAATGAAPKALKPEEMTAATLGTGIKAGIVPGLFGGWIALLDRFGTMSLAELLEPAIEYAEQGYPIDPANVASIQSARATFEKWPTSAAVFLPNGKVPAAGQRFTMTDLAATFRKVAEAEQAARRAGRSRSDALKAAHDRFYKGDIAQEFVRFSKENGGLFSAEDFASYQPLWKDPVHTTYRGYDVYSSPSTSRGGIEMMMQLNLVEGFDLKGYGRFSRETLHLIAESIKVAKADVYRYVADPAFTQIPLGGMLSKAYAAGRRKLISLDRAMAYPAPGTPDAAPTADGVGSLFPAIADRVRSGGKKTPDPFDPSFDARAQDGHTTTFSVVDRQGNVVACTPTLGGSFGAQVVMGKTGILFNNGMRIGSTSPYPTDVNYVAPGKIPLLNNSPLIVMKDGKFVMAYGSPGGETIGQTEFQVLLNVIDFNMRIQDAVEAPRFALSATPNFYKPGADVSWTLESRVPPEVVKALEAMGHKIRLTSAFGGAGSNHGILVDLATGTMTAGADPRRTGYAVGF